MKKILAKLFNLIENLYRAKNNWKVIPGSETHYIYVDILKHKGKEVQLSDGTKIIKGDTVAEIHVNNRKMVEVSPRTVLKEFISEMRLLSKAMAEDEEFQYIKALFGRTVLYPIPRRVGFEVFDLEKSFFKQFIKVWDNIIKMVFSSSQKGKTIMKEPKEIWISKQSLINKMGEK